MDIPSSFFQKCFNYGLHKNSPFGTKFFVRLIFEAFSRKKPPKGAKAPLRVHKIIRSPTKTF